LPAGELAKRLEISKSNLSQHLSIMKDKGVLVERKEGLNVFYKVTNKKVTKAFNLMKELLAENLNRKSDLLKT
jgi:ArsR family transcriptional regulator